MTRNQIEYWKLQEDKRNNQVNNYIAQSNYEESVKHNRNTEQELNRTNLVNEGIKRDTLSETMRSNLVNEGIKRDTLTETQRANRVKESQGWASLDIQAASLNETINHNREQENIGYLNAQASQSNADARLYSAEVQHQHNQNTETQAFLDYSESVRSHKKNEDLTKTRDENTNRNQVVSNVIQFTHNAAGTWTDMFRNFSNAGKSFAPILKGQ